MSDTEPLEWKCAPLKDGLQWQKDLQKRAQAMVGVSGMGQLPSNAREKPEKSK